MIVPTIPLKGAIQDFYLSFLPFVTFSKPCRLIMVWEVFNVQGVNFNILKATFSQCSFSFPQAQFVSFLRRINRVIVLTFVAKNAILVLQYSNVLQAVLSTYFCDE